MDRRCRAFPDPDAGAIGEVHHIDGVVAVVLDQFNPGRPSGGDPALLGTNEDLCRGATWCAVGHRRHTSKRDHAESGVRLGV